MFQSIKGKVIRGQNLGSKLGFPTANIKLDSSDIEDGTYKLNGVIDGKVFQGAGVYIKEKKLFEAHFFDLNQDLYGKEIEIIIFYKLRENRKFNSLTELKSQIKSDIEQVKNITDYVVTFGTFDIVHPGHKYYLNNAKKYANKLITVIARDANVTKLKNVVCENDENIRLKNVKNTGISDIVLLGDLLDPLSIIKKYSPKVVCLGYDQVGFIDILKKYLEEKNLKIKIVRISAYKEDVYKSSIIKNK